MTAPLSTLLKPAPHPILPVPRAEDIEAMLATEQGAAAYAAWFNRHTALLAAAEEDPLYHGLELDCWKVADEQLADPELDIQVNFGWNRGGGKTYRALKRLCEAARVYPASGSAGYLILGETEDSNTDVQMPPVRDFLWKYIGHLNGKQGGRYRVNYKPGTGFTEGVLVIPAGPILGPEGEVLGYEGTSNIWFDTYKGDPGKYEGLEFGGRLPVSGYTASGKPILALKTRAGAPPRPRPEDFNVERSTLNVQRSTGEPEGAAVAFEQAVRQWEARWLIQNVGVVADESLALNWFRMIARRAPYRTAKTIWSFTPIKGITPCVKEVVGTLEVESDAPALLPPLPEVKIHGCRKGHMPVTGTCSWKRTKAVYFHLSHQAFNNYDRIVLDGCKGKDMEYIQRMAYGYALDTVGRQFGNAGPWNWCDAADLPAVATDYQVVDYHSERPCFCTWLRVSPGLEPEKPYLDVWAEWPDMPSFGEWAVATERETNSDSRKGWDGDRGPAQTGMGLGWSGYKRVWQKIETVGHQSADEADPLRAEIQKRARAAGRPLRQIIFERIIDSRAGPTKSLTDHGQTCPVWEFAKVHHDPQTGEEQPPIDFRMADGSRHDWNMVRELLEVPRDAEGQIIGRPRLRVVRTCEQTKWAIENFTGLGGDAGACKDPIDNLEYAARGELVHVAPGMLGSRGGGSY